MDVIKIIGIGLISLIVIIIIRQYRPEFAIYISIIAGVLTGIIQLLQSISKKTYINNQYLSIILKITGIALLTEFAVSICKDAGESAIASKIDIGSKIIIISMSIPIINNLLEIILKILP